jgi:outer membrane lipoprotein-sorting protein
MRRFLGTIAGMFLLSMSAFAADPSVEELLEATDDVGRGSSSAATMVMQVKTAHYERSMKMQAWSQGTERSLIRILEPAKDAGVTTLKVDDNMWNYLPKVDRVMKIPAGMMSGSWMGSHFTNDDLVREVRLSTDYKYTLDSRPADNPEGVYVITLVPNEDVPVVWGKVVVRVYPTKVPLDVRYYDEAGALARTMSFADPVDFGRGLMPRKMTLTPANAPGEYTAIIYEKVDFTAAVDASMFSLQNLKQ